LRAQGWRGTGRWRSWRPRHHRAAAAGGRRWPARGRHRAGPWHPVDQPTVVCRQAAGREVSMMMFLESSGQRLRRPAWLVALAGRRCPAGRVHVGLAGRAGRPILHAGGSGRAGEAQRRGRQLRPRGRPANTLHRRAGRRRQPAGRRRDGAADVAERAGRRPRRRRPSTQDRQPHTGLAGPAQGRGRLPRPDRRADPRPGAAQATIARSLGARRPVVAVFSTPVYCVSRAAGQRRHPGRAGGGPAAAAQLPTRCGSPTSRACLPPRSRSWTGSPASRPTCWYLHGD
jgi:hypothetical protein